MFQSKIYQIAMAGDGSQGQFSFPVLAGVYQSQQNYKPDIRQKNNLFGKMSKKDRTCGHQSMVSLDSNSDVLAGMQIILLFYIFCSFVGIS